MYYLVQTQGEGGEERAGIREEQSLFCLGEAGGGTGTQGKVWSCFQKAKGRACKVSKAGGRGCCHLLPDQSFPTFQAGRNLSWQMPGHTSHLCSCITLPSPHTGAKVTTFVGHIPTHSSPQSCLSEHRDPSPCAVRTWGLCLVQGSEVTRPHVPGLYIFYSGGPQL